MSKNNCTYTVNIPHYRQEATDAVIEEYLKANPLADIDDALDAIFAAGVRLALDGGILKPVTA